MFDKFDLDEIRGQIAKPNMHTDYFFPENEDEEEPPHECYFKPYIGYKNVTVYLEKCECGEKQITWSLQPDSVEFIPSDDF